MIGRLRYRAADRHALTRRPDSLVLQRADRARPGFREAVHRTLKALRPDPHTVLRKLQQHGVAGAIAAIPFADVLGMARYGLRSAIIPALPTGQTFADPPPHTADWLDEHIESLIGQITEDTKLTIEHIAQTMLAQGLPLDITAQAISRVVGLTEPQANAVQRLAGSLRATGAPEGQVQQQAQDYADRLLAQRAQTIASTETVKASNRAEVERFNQRVQQGELDPRLHGLQWVTAEDDQVCTAICAPMDGVTVQQGEMFDTPDGPMLHPPAHPHCRCTVVVVEL